MHSGGFSKEGAQKTTGTQQKVAPGVHFPFSIKNLNEVVSKESDGRLTVKTVRVEKVRSGVNI